MTSLLFHRNLKERDATHLLTQRGMAHFAGTGPLGTTCGGCAHWDKDGARRAHICRKARQLGSHSKEHIAKDTAACKYFEARPEGRAS